MQEHTVAIDIDDIIEGFDTFESCLFTVKKTNDLFQSTSYVIHPEKSQFIPSKKMEYVGVFFQFKQKDYIFVGSEKDKDIS